MTNESVAERRLASRDVSCPTCGAGVRERCRGSIYSGRSHRAVGYHTERRLAAREQRRHRTDAGGVGALVALVMLALGLGLAGAGLGLTYLPAPWGLIACAPLLVALGVGTCRFAHWARRRAEIRDMREIAREIVARSRQGGGRWSL